MPTLDEDRINAAAAEFDPDALPITAEQICAMVPIRVLCGRSELA
jgi:hypothetical protein